MTQSFEEFNLQEFLLEGLNSLGISKPTPVQMQVIPAVLQGRDVIGQSQTGTGKTLAYVLPILQRLDKSRHELQAMVLAPTRELIRQIASVFEELSGDSGLDMLLIHGGVDVNRQIQRLKRNPQVIIGTPGRILDLIDQEKLPSHTVKSLVIDEADTMLEMGFKAEIEQVLQRVKKDTQIMFFAATMPPRAAEMAKSVMKRPHYVTVNPEHKTLSSIENVIFKVREGGKEEELIKLIRLYNPYLGIVFTKKKEQVNDLITQLRAAGFEVEGLHGEMQRGQRKQAMQRFAEARSQILVATDIASRGLDIEGVSHIFNFDPPMGLDQYIHRIGRTGRAGATGVAVNLVNPAEELKLKNIAEKLGQPFKEKTILKNEIVDKPARRKETAGKGNAAKGSTAVQVKSDIKGKAKTKKYTGPNSKKKAVQEAHQRMEKQKAAIPKPIRGKKQESPKRDTVKASAGKPKATSGVKGSTTGRSSRPDRSSITDRSTTPSRRSAPDRSSTAGRSGTPGRSSTPSRSKTLAGSSPVKRGSK